MWQAFINWLKKVFSHQAPIHQEDNGLWWQQDSNVVKVGLQTKIIDELGNITFFDTPRLNEKITKADQLIDIEGGKAVETFKSPVSGKISKVYNEFQDFPNKLSETTNPLLVEITVD